MLRPMSPDDYLSDNCPNSSWAKRKAEETMRTDKRIIIVMMCLLMIAGTASGQLSGENVKGDNGLKSGSQPGPGTYITNLNYFYGSSEIKLPNRTVDLPGGLNLYLNGTAITRVTKAKFLGANYGVQFVVPALNTQLELPRARTGKGGFGISDLYVMPLYLGWHKKRADYTASFAFYAPTGRFTAGGNDNTGLGMWSYEINGGTTVYPDKNRTWNIATLASYEMHGKKRGADIKVGDILTLEGGVGKTFPKSMLDVGVVYYAQWKVTADSGSDLARILQLHGVGMAKNRAFALGGEFGKVFPKLDSQFNVRVLKEFGNSTATQGHAVVASFTFFVDRPFRKMREAQKAAAKAKQSEQR